MVAIAHMFTFQQQLRQEMTDVIQQLHTEMNQTVNGRIDMLSSIGTALQQVSANPVVPSHTESSAIPRNCEGSNDKG